MELSEGPKAEIRHTVRKYLDDLEHFLTGDLTEKLAERKRSFAWWTAQDVC